MTVRGFLSLDVETANEDFASICSIGIARFRDNQYVEQLEILIDPETRFSPRNVQIHGIRPEDVDGKPNMAQVLPIVAAQLANTIVTHHSQFDRGALAAAASRYSISMLDCFWLDTLSVAKRVWPELADQGGFGLANIARFHGIEFSHHNAAEDARASGLIMLRAMDHSGLGFEDWLEMLDCTPDPTVSVTRQNKKQIYARYARSGIGHGRLSGEIVVFTGFLSIDREAAAQLAASAGCTVADSVTKKTTIVVVGDQDTRLTNGREKSTKQIRAEEYAARGIPIRIIRESDFMVLLS